jgi:dolichyl-phosphate beta-glucosyltransferase
MQTDHELTLVIPAFEEERRLPQTLAVLADQLTRWGIDYRVLVVDDGSGDQTAAIPSRFGPRFATIRHPYRSGKGAAIRRGVLASTGRFVGFTDADLPYDPDVLRVAYEALRAGAADAVFGVRDPSASISRVRRRVSRRIATQLFRLLADRALRLSAPDPQCALKVFSRRAAADIFARTRVDGFACDSEMSMLARELDLRVRTVPVTWLNDDSSTVSLWRHALPMAVDVLRMRSRHAAGRTPGHREQPAAT